MGLNFREILQGFSYFVFHELGRYQRKLKYGVTKYSQHEGKISHKIHENFVHGNFRVQLDPVVQVSN